MKALIIEDEKAAVRNLMALLGDMFIVMAAARKERAVLVLPIDRRIPDKRL